jgi:hypothetical protein
MNSEERMKIWQKSLNRSCLEWKKDLMNQNTTMMKKPHMKMKLMIKINHLYLLKTPQSLKQILRWLMKSLMRLMLELIYFGFKS